jgi:RNase P subunit RPR2
MSRKIARICPRCNGYLGVTLGERSRKSMTQSVNGSCLVCSHKLTWTLVHGTRPTKGDNSGRIPKLFGRLTNSSRIIPTNNQ